MVPGDAQSGRETASKVNEQVLGRVERQSILGFGDGFNGDAEQFCGAIPSQPSQIAGALSSGDLHTGNTYQMAGNQTGPWLRRSCAEISEWRLVMTTVGYRLVNNSVLHARAAFGSARWMAGGSELYSELFGYPPRDWAFPPLSHLARLYPLGVEQGEELAICSPIRVEADGSFLIQCVHSRWH